MDDGIIVIESGDYERNRKSLMKEQIVIDMANDISNYAYKDGKQVKVGPTGDTLTHISGEPTFEFMMSANTEYHRRGGHNNESIGAVANAILRLLNGKVKNS
jgi:hypothetical protein